MVNVQEQATVSFKWRTALIFFGGWICGGLVIGAVFLVTNQGSDSIQSERSTANQHLSDTSITEKVVETKGTSYSDRGERSMNLSDLVVLNPIARKSKLKVFMARAKEGELVDLLMQTKDIIPKELGIEFQNTIVEQFALVNPKRTVEAVKGLQKDQLGEAKLIKSIFNVWGVSDLDQAIQYAKQQDESFREYAAEGIITVRDDLSPDERHDIALQIVGEESIVWTLGAINLRRPIENPSETWNEFMEEKGHQLGQLDLFDTGYLGRVAHALAGEIGLEAAMSKIDAALPDGRIKSSVYTTFFHAVSEEDPYQALELAIGLDDVRHASAITGILAQNVAATDPKGAVNLVSSIKASGVRNMVMRGIIDTWIESDPYGVVANLELLPENQRTNARVDALVAIAADSTDAATRMLLDVDHYESKVTVASAIFSNLAKSDVQSAISWLQSDATVAPLQKELMPSVIADIASKDPEYAMQIALSVAIDDHEVGLEALVIKTVAVTNVDKAIEMLSETRNEKTKATAREEIGTILVRDGDAERAIELGQQLTDEKERSNYYVTLIPELIRAAPRVFVDNLESFPKDRKTVITVQAYMFLPTFTGELSDEQQDKVREHFSLPSQEGLDIFSQIELPPSLMDGLRRPRRGN